MSHKPVYTTKKGQMVGFGECGISDEGVRKYKELLNNLKRETKADKRHIRDAWDLWTEANGFTYEYVRNKKKKKDPEPAVAREHDGEELILRGDSGDAGDDGWDLSDEEEVVNEDNEERRDVVIEDQEAADPDVTVTPTPNKRHKGDRDFAGSDDDEDDDDDSTGKVGRGFIGFLGRRERELQQV